MLLLSEQQQSARLAKELEAAKSALTALQEQQNPSLAEELKKTQQMLASLQETEKKAREETTRLEKMAESVLTVFSAFWRSARNAARYVHVSGVDLRRRCLGPPQGWKLAAYKRPVVLPGSH